MRSSFRGVVRWRVHTRAPRPGRLRGPLGRWAPRQSAACEVDMPYRVEGSAPDTSAGPKHVAYCADSARQPCHFGRKLAAICRPCADGTILGVAKLGPRRRVRPPPNGRRPRRPPHDAASGVRGASRARLRPPRGVAQGVEDAGSPATTAGSRGQPIAHPLLAEIRYTEATVTDLAAACGVKAAPGRFKMGDHRAADRRARVVPLPMPDVREDFGVHAVPWRRLTRTYWRSMGSCGAGARRRR